MTDPIEAIEQVSPVLRASTTSPSLVDNLDGFFEGISKVDTDPNTLVADYAAQMSHSDEINRALSNPALLGPLGENPNLQKLMQLKLDASLKHSELMQERFASKVENSLVSTRVKYLTTALSKAMNGISQLLQGN